MPTRRLFHLVVAALLVSAAGCKLKRDPENVFPGQPGYDKRIASFNLDPDHAYQRALVAAQRDGRTEYVGRRPTIIHGKYYVFSNPVANGANLKGYHVHGQTAEVKFYTRDEILKIK